MFSRGKDATPTPISDNLKPERCYIIFITKQGEACCYVIPICKQIHNREVCLIVTASMLCGLGIWWWSCFT